MEGTTAQSVVFNDLFGKTLLASFDQPTAAPMEGRFYSKPVTRSWIDRGDQCLPS